MRRRCASLGTRNQKSRLCSRRAGRVWKRPRLASCRSTDSRRRSSTVSSARGDASSGRTAVKLITACVPRRPAAAGQRRLPRQHAGVEQRPPQPRLRRVQRQPLGVGKVEETRERLAAVVAPLTEGRAGVAAGLDQRAEFAVVEQAVARCGALRRRGRAPSPSGRARCGWRRWQRRGAARTLSQPPSLHGLTMPGEDRTRTGCVPPRADLREPGMHGIDDQIVFGRLDVGRDPQRQFGARIEPSVAERLRHDLAVAPVARQPGGLRGPNHQAVGQFESEQGLPDRRDAVRMNALLELRQRARRCAVDHPTRCSSRSQTVPAARRQSRAVGLIDNGLRDGQADAEDSDAQAAAP